MADNATLKSQYVTQVEADLDRTAKEKERLATDIGALQEQLAALEQDHALLVGVQRTLTDGSASASARKSGPARSSSAAAPTAPSRARKPKTAPAPRSPQPAAKKPAVKKAPADKPASSGKPTLRDLVLGHLTGHGEPRLAAEVATALGQAHPDRKIQTTVVRNTLEALVAKGHALRSRQQKSVYYTSAANASATAAADTDSAATTDR
jgi:hypothetical protein